MQAHKVPNLIWRCLSRRPHALAAAGSLVFFSFGAWDERVSSIAVLLDSKLTKRICVVKRGQTSLRLHKDTQKETFIEHGRKGFC